MPTETRNARIRSTYLGAEDHGFFIAQLNLDYGGVAQSFQVIASEPGLDHKTGRTQQVGSAFGMESVRQICRVVGVDSWEELPGQVCRARIDDGLIAAVGHFMADEWFDRQKFWEQHYGEGSE